MITDVIAFISICLTSYLLSTLWRSWPIRSCCGKRKKEKKKRKLSNYKREKRQRCILYRCMDVYMASLQRGEKKKKVGIDLMPYRDTGEMQPGRGEWGGGLRLLFDDVARVLLLTSFACWRWRLFCCHLIASLSLFWIRCHMILLPRTWNGSLGFTFRTPKNCKQTNK